MKDSLKLEGKTFSEFGDHFAAAVRALPAESGERLKRIQDEYFGAFGIRGAYERLNNRTVAQIFAEYCETRAKPTVSGEIDGVKYALYPSPNRQETHIPDSEKNA